jgi:hypothetical protein
LDDNEVTLGARLFLFFSALMFGGLIALLSQAAFGAEPIVTESTSTVTTNGSMNTRVESPPPSAIAPQFSTGNNNDLCTIGAGGAVQTQILGISVGSTFTEENCLRLKKASKLYSFGMKVAAVSVMCQDKDVFDAMMNAGTPCPYNGLIGDEAKAAWEVHTDKTPVEGEEDEQTAEDKRNTALGIIGGVFGSLLFF